MRRLGFAQLIASRASPQRERVVAMVVARILEPDSKLATTRWWQVTTLPEILGITDADEDDLYDAMALYDLSSSYFEGVSCPLAAERLVACRNPQLAKRRTEKRNSLLEATRQELDKVCGMVARGRLRGKDKIGVRVGKVVNKYKVAKHFQLDIRDDGFDFEIDHEKVAEEAALDGVYVVRTSLAAERLSADDTVRSYKRLSQVERAFRSLKTVDLEAHPIRHRLEDRVRAHFLLCMLAYYVQWHMLEAWRPLLFSDEDQQAKASRDPVAPAKRSPNALRKVHSRVLDDGSQVHSFRTLLRHLSGIVRNICRVPGAAPNTPTFDVVTTPNRQEQRAFDLLETIERRQ